MMLLRRFPASDAARMLYTLIFDPGHAAACNPKPWRRPSTGGLLLPPLKRVPAKHSSHLHLLQRLLGTLHPGSNNQHLLQRKPVLTLLHWLCKLCRVYPACLLPSCGFLHILEEACADT